MAKIKYLTSSAAATILGFTPSHIRRLCIEGKIKAEKFGNDWIIEEKDIRDIKRLRKKSEKEL